MWKKARHWLQCWGWFVCYFWMGQLVSGSSKLSWCTRMKRVRWRKETISRSKAASRKKKSHRARRVKWVKEKAIKTFSLFFSLSSFVREFSALSFFSIRPLSESLIFQCARCKLDGFSPEAFPHWQHLSARERRCKVHGKRPKDRNGFHHRSIRHHREQLCEAQAKLSRTFSVFSLVLCCSQFFLCISRAL